MQARIGGVWRTIAAAKAYINGAWRTPSTAKAYVSGAWRTVANFVSPITLAITGQYQSISSTSQSQTATPTGGLAPFAYVWATVSSSYPLTFSGGTAATTTVATSSPYTDEYVTVQCTVTDALGTSATATQDLLLRASTSRFNR